ncbi:unnamed protein product [Soboliphyme baturini]|uniref:Growth hormone-inducible transmembrane protein n=1 Tax=Soboliphyme baturini TaxID=241478 RepID=A0A183IZQ9_9BILA|nr:unnamed protein product [Soboliphyme baturini]
MATANCRSFYKAVFILPRFSNKLSSSAFNFGVAFRSYANYGNIRRVSKVVERKTLKEFLTSPATETPFALGRLFAAGGAAVGLGALCFYGLGLSNQVGTLWPQYVRERIHSTYEFLGGSLVLTAASAVAIAKNKTMMAFLTRNSFLTMAGTIAAMIGTTVACQSIAYEPGKIGAKQLFWALNCGVIGAVIAPLTFLGGPLMLRALCYTGGIVGGLSAVAVCAPSDRFLNMGGALGIGLGVVFVSCLGTFFLPPTTMLGAGLYSVATYGGLVLFSGFLLYDTQRVVKVAELYPYYAITPFDPINAQLGIYMDIINIFIRMVMILGGGGGTRRR